MVDEIQIYSSPDFGEIRTLTVDGEPWFSGKDVAGALGYSNAQKAVRDHVDEEDRTVNESFTVNGTPLTLINESGLYSLILTSKLPSAREFKRWVTSSVLPMIRKTGIYSAQAAIANGDSSVPMRTLTPDDYIAAARLIAGCRNDRLKIVLNLLARGGWDIEEAQICLTNGGSTADIGPRIRKALQEHQMSLADLAAKTGIGAEVLRAYRDGRRFPRPARYDALVSALNAL